MVNQLLYYTVIKRIVQQILTKRQDIVTYNADDKDMDDIQKALLSKKIKRKVHPIFYILVFNLVLILGFVLFLTKG